MSIFQCVVVEKMNETLKQFVDNHFVIDNECLLKIGYQSLQLLQGLHALGITHNDLRPENLILERLQERIHLRFKTLKYANQVGLQPRS